MAVREKSKTKAETTDLPQEVEFILSALEAGNFGRVNERRSGAGRQSYRIKAHIELYSDPEGTPPWVIFTRDVNARSLGFITRHRLPLGYGGIVELIDPQGNKIRLDCTLLRCREAVSGWYEGAMYFNRQQPQFNPAR